MSTGGPAEQGDQKRADPGDAHVPGQFRHVPDSGFVPGSVPAASPETRFAILRMGLVRLRSLKKKSFERYFPNIPKIFTQKNIFIILRNNSKSLKTKSKSSWRRPGQDPGARWPMHDNHQFLPQTLQLSGPRSIFCFGHFPHCSVDEYVYVWPSGSLLWFV